MVSNKSSENDPTSKQFSSIEWLTDRAVEKHKEGKLEEAITSYLEVIDLESNQPDWIYADVIDLVAREGYLSKSKELVEQASKLHPNSVKIKQLFAQLFTNSQTENFDSTESIDTNDVTFGVQQKIEQLHIEGPQKYQTDDLPGALECYQEAIQLNQHSPEWVYGSAIIISAKLGQLEEALELGKKALTLYPNSDEIHRSVGILFEAKEELDNSIEHYSKSLALNPNQPDWVTVKLADHLESMSLKKRQQGDVQQAKKLFGESVKVKQQVNPSPGENKLVNISSDNIAKEKPLKGAVVSWDMSHNPAGRAYLLADMAKMHFEMELIGPIFSFYGKDIWSPIKNQSMEMNVFPTASFSEFVKGAVKLAKLKKYDFVYVSKPRFPSLFIGMLIKHYSQCPLILDVDDHELSFFKNKPLAEFEELISSPRDQEWYKPYSEIWTRFTESLIPTADALTVSNIALQQRFGGVIVRHARNENIFDPQLYSRINIRSQFGYQEQDRVILFLGTPRPHKGIFNIAQALDNLNDPRLVLCIVGTINDKRIANKFAEYKNARIDFHDNQPWERLPELVSMADLICILQDPSSPIADYQIPAKLTDAMAMGVPTMVTKVPPLQDLIASKSVIAVETDNLEAAIEDFFQNENAKILEYSRERYTYIGEFTYGVNAERIKQTLNKAKRNFKPFPEIYTKIFDLISLETGIKILDDEPFNSLQSASPSKQEISINSDEPFNVLFFWKQNDSDLYGRRQDMIAKYLANSDRVNKVIHFDAPISAENLQEMVQHGPKAKFSQNNLVFTNTVDRFLGLKDTTKIIKRTFVYRDNNSGEKFLGRILPKKSDYPNFVRQVIQEAGVGRNTVAWVCPVNFEFPELHQELNFGCVIADIIDDQRQWDVKPQYLVRLSENYQQILKSANIAFTNCEPVKQSFEELNSQIDVIPNGSELFPQIDNWSKPEFLAGLQGPIIGYVGNLSDRIDIELLKYIAVQNPDWNIIMIGSAHGSAQIFELVEYANIHLLGVKPYDEAVKFIRYFDVAMIPHINNKLTKNMNCLKLYVYFAVGIPIVTTEISNIDEFAGSIYIAQDREDFNQGIKKVLAGNGINPNIQKRKLLLNEIDWQNRVDNIMTRLDKYFSENNLSKDSNQFTLTDRVKPLFFDDFPQHQAMNSTADSQKSARTTAKSTKQTATLSQVELSYSGYCNICGQQQTFVKNHRSLREGYQCCNCKASLRYRGQAEAIIQNFGKSNTTLLKDLAQDSDFKNVSIYEPGVIGPFRKYFGDFGNYTNSYFWSDVSPGSYRDGVQCQNLENLTYNDDSFDLIITSDIMERVRHPWTSFQEIRRVLKPGGYHICSIPIQIPLKQESFYRVDTSKDEDIHLVEPRYHSAPKPGGGRSQSLVYVDFGQDIVEQLEKIGYRVKLASPNISNNCDAHRLITLIAQKF